VRYFNDLFVYELDEGRWLKVGDDAGGANPNWPPPRSACGFVADAGGAVMYGGCYRTPGDDGRFVVHNG
jgi:hypothetical protein